MEFIFALVIFLIFLGSSSGGERSSNNNGNSYKKHNTCSKRQDDCDDFDPADTFHLEDGLDHEVDCDGYCEECDDYHE